MAKKIPEMRRVNMDVGDKVVMNRNCEQFDGISNSTTAMGWWTDMEKVQPLTIKDVNLFDGVATGYSFFETEYEASESWVIPHD